MVLSLILCVTGDFVKNQLVNMLEVLVIFTEPCKSRIKCKTASVSSISDWPNQRRSTHNFRFKTPKE